MTAESSESTESEAPDDAAEPVSRRAPFAANPSVGARGQQARQKILDAAIQVFGELGYHGCRISRITELTGLSRVSFYQYFSSKEDLFRQLAGMVAHELQASIDDLPDIGPGPDGWEVLHAWLDRFSEIYDSYESVFVAFQSAVEADASILVGADRVGERTNTGLQSKVVGSPLTKNQVKGTVATFFEATMRGNRRTAIAEAEWPETIGHRRAGLNIALADVFHRVLFGVDPGVNVHLQEHPERAGVVPVGDDGAASVDGDGPPLSAAATRTRDLLIETSHAVFVERGLHPTRVDDIVEAAGVSHGIFYRYFSSKNEVFGLLALRAGRRMAEVIGGLRDLDTPVPGQDEALVEWLARYSGTYAEEGPIISAWVEAMSRRGRLDDLSRGAIESGHQAFVDFLGRREFGDVASEAVVLMVLLDTMCAQPPTARRMSFFSWLLERGLFTAPT